jgi:hypothetical protein
VSEEAKIEWRKQFDESQMRAAEAVKRLEDDLDRMWQEQVVREMDQAAADRDLFNDIKLYGTTFYRHKDILYPVCETKEAYVRYISYITNNAESVKEKDKDLCWELDNGDRVEFTPDSSIDRHCIPSVGVCEFQYESFSLFRPTFWTSIHAFSQPTE